MTMIVPTVITMIVPVSAIIATIAIATEPQHNPYATVTPPRISISIIIVGVVIVGITIAITVAIVPVTISMTVAIMPVTISATVSRIVISTIAPPIIIPSSVASISGEFHRIGNLLHSR